MTNKETSSKKPPEKNDPIKKGIEILDFFDHRIRQEMKTREEVKESSLPL